MKIFSLTSIIITALQCPTIDAAGRRLRRGLRGLTTEISSEPNDSITYIKLDGENMPVFGRDVEPNMDFINQVLKDRLGIAEDENFTLDDDDHV